VAQGGREREVGWLMKCLIDISVDCHLFPLLYVNRSDFADTVEPRATAGDNTRHHTERRAESVGAHVRRSCRMVARGRPRKQAPQTPRKMYTTCRKGHGCAFLRSGMLTPSIDTEGAYGGIEVNG